jgi:hypothetical protein
MASQSSDKLATPDLKSKCAGGNEGGENQVGEISAIGREFA